MACFKGITGGLNLADCLTLNSSNDKVSDFYNEPADLINIIVPNLFALSGVFLFGMTIFAGFKFISGGAKAKDEARTIVQTVLVGFLVMFAAYWIVQVIELLIGTDILL